MVSTLQGLLGVFVCQFRVSGVREGSCALGFNAVSEDAAVRFLRYDDIEAWVSSSSSSSSIAYGSFL